MEIAQDGTKILVREMERKIERLFVLTPTPNPATCDQVNLSSPTGRDLCGRKIDDVFSLTLPEGGRVKCEVLDVLRI